MSHFGKLQGRGGPIHLEFLVEKSTTLDRIRKHNGLTNNNSPRQLISMVLRLPATSSFAAVSPDQSILRHLSHLLLRPSLNVHDKLCHFA